MCRPFRPRPPGEACHCPKRLTLFRQLNLRTAERSPSVRRPVASAHSNLNRARCAAVNRRRAAGGRPTRRPRRQTVFGRRLASAAGDQWQAAARGSIDWPPQPSERRPPPPRHICCQSEWRLQYALVHFGGASWDEMERNGEWVKALENADLKRWTSAGFRSCLSPRYIPFQIYSKLVCCAESGGGQLNLLSKNL